MTVEEMKQKKKELNLTDSQIAAMSGVPLSTVQKIFGGIDFSPEYKSLQALEKVFAGCSQQEKPCYPDFLSDPSVPYGHRESKSYPLLPDGVQGEYTASDLETLPEDAHVELIDGVIYDMAAPNNIHQIILGELYDQIRQCIKSCGEDCFVFFGPSDVWLTKDGKNVLQPDLYVLCDRSMLGVNGHTIGAPPFVVEILSPSTRGRDLLLKNYKYSISGVREYWCIDPVQKSVFVYDYSKDADGTHPHHYTFSDVVSIGISEGKCSIDFKEISQVLEKFFSV